MTISKDLALGRWRMTLRVLVALTMVLSLGACERAAGPDASKTEEGSTESFADVGPDWEIVEDYLQRQHTWMEKVRGVAFGEASEDDSSPRAGGEASSPQPRMVVLRAPGDGSPSNAEVEERLREAIEAQNGSGVLSVQFGDEDSPSRALVDELLRAAADAQKGAEVADLRFKGEDSPPGAEEVAPDPPDVGRAAAAALAILEQGGTHDKTVEAAEFLVNHAAMAPGGGEYASRGAKALLEFAPDYHGWSFMLQRMHVLGRFGEDKGAAADAFFEELASEADDPVLRAAGRYYIAAGRMQSANAPGMSEEDRAVKRQSALDAATGLSAGVEEEALSGGARTFADAEADLIRSIRHATVGSKLPDLTGRRLDGVEEGLSDYRGRVVLLDFWATWCVPCVAALPQKRLLVADLPVDRFVLLSISVDAKLETVTRFMDDEPMPWANWHVGMTSEITRTLAVSSYPTYILVDENGEILARTNHLPDEFVALVEETVGYGSEA